MTRRPFFLTLLSFIAAVTAAELFPTRAGAVLWSAVAAAGLSLLSFALSRLTKRPLCVLLSLLTLAASAGLFSHYRLLDRAEARLLAAENPTLTLTVVESGTHTNYGASFLCAAERLDGAICRATVRLETDGSTPYPLGTRLAIKGSITRPEDGIAGGFSERRWLRSLGVIATVSADGEGIFVLGEAKTPRVIAARFRETVTARVEHAAAYRDGGLCAALLTGVRDGIDPHFTLALRRAGVSHLFAISGMHFAMLLGAVSLLTHRLQWKQKTRRLCTVAVAAFYCAVAGFAPSVMRAGFMLGAVGLGLWLGRDRDSFTALAAAVALILLCEPWAASGCALWLSAAATAGLLAAAPVLDRLIFAKKRRPKPRQAFVTKILIPTGLACAAGVFTMPLSALFFGQVSLAAPLSTLVATPLVSVLLVCAILFALVGVPMPIVTPVAAWTAKALNALLGAIASPGFVVVPLGRAVLPLGVLTAAGGFALWLFSHRKRPRLAAFLCALAIGAVPVGVTAARLCETDALTFGFASFDRSDLVVFRDSGAVVFDLSTGYSRANAAVGALSDALGRTEIETLVITRLDHAAVRSIRELGCDTVIREVLLPPAVTDAERAAAQQCANVAALCHATVGGYEYGTPFVRGAVRFVCYPPRYLARSVVPVRCFTAERWTGDGSGVAGAKLCYLGAGIAELPPEAFAEARANATCLLSGAAGPIERVGFVSDEAPVLYGTAVGERGQIFTVKE